MEKLSLYLYTYNINNDHEYLNLKKLTIRQHYHTTEHDSVYNVLKQIINLKKFSIYEGKISARSLNILMNYELESLKIHNTTINGLNVSTVIKILKNKNLKVLHATSEKYFKFPGPTRLIHYFLDLCNNYQPQIEELTFTLDFRDTIHYENLSRITSLKEVKVYYATLSFTNNLEAIVRSAIVLPYTQFYFIEFLEIPYCTTYFFYEQIIEHSAKFEYKINQLIKFYNVQNVHVKPLNHEQCMRMHRCDRR